MSEESKVKIRNIRRDANEQLKDLKKDNTISEDELYDQQEEVQKITNKYIEKVDQALAVKEKEILEI